MLHKILKVHQLRHTKSQAGGSKRGCYCGTKCAAKVSYRLCEKSATSEWKLMSRSHFKYIWSNLIIFLTV